MQMRALRLCFFLICSALVAGEAEIHNGMRDKANAIVCDLVEGKDAFQAALKDKLPFGQPALIDGGELMGLTYRGFKPGLDGFFDMLTRPMLGFNDPKNTDKSSNYYLGSTKVQYLTYTNRPKLYLKRDDKKSITRILLQTSSEGLREYFIDENGVFLFQRWENKITEIPLSPNTILKIEYNDFGTPSEGQTGRLFIDGKEIEGKEDEIREFGDTKLKRHPDKQSAPHLPKKWNYEDINSITNSWNR